MSEIPRLQYIGPWVTFGQAQRIVELAREQDPVQIVSLGEPFIKVVWYGGEEDINAAGEEVHRD